MAQLALDVRRDSDSEAFRFFGMNRVAGQGSSAELSALASLKLPDLGPSAPVEIAPDAVVLTANLRIAGELDVDIVGFKTQDATNGQFVVAVEVTGTDVNAGIKVSLPELPALTVALPRISLRTLRLNGLRWHGDAAFWREFQPLTLPLPRLAKLKLEMRWTNVPEFVLAVDRNGALTIATTNPGAGELILRDSTQRFIGIADMQLNRTKAGSTRRFSEINSPRQQLYPARGWSFEIDRPDELPLIVRGRLGPATITLQTATNGTGVEIKLPVKRLELVAREDPSIVLVVALELVTTISSAGSSEGVNVEIENPRVIEPYPIALARADGNSVGGLIRIVAGLNAPTVASPQLPLDGVARVMQRVGDLLWATVDWFAREVGATAGQLSRPCPGTIGGSC